MIDALKIKTDFAEQTDSAPLLPSGPLLTYATGILLGAYLLFQVEPIIAKQILPWFGGSAAVWTTCLVFFQVTLLFGYLYANWLATRLGQRAQVWTHGALLVLSILFLPIIPGMHWKPWSSENPTLLILELLGSCVGLPFFLLASTSPLYQFWYAQEVKSTSPYFLYSVSNFASLAALLIYPVLVEPRLNTRAQSLMWSWSYLAFVIVSVITLAHLYRRRNVWREVKGKSVVSNERVIASDHPSTWRLRSLWTVFAFCPSALLLAVTNYLCQDVAAIPFLWILPLSLYLFSFVICFGWARAYVRSFFMPLLPLVIAAMSYRMYSQSIFGGLPMTLFVFGVGFFVCCMVCHGELVRMKPSVGELTRFYLMISWGGALGGLFVGVLAPYCFVGNFELPLGITMSAILALVAIYRDQGSRFYRWNPRPAWILMATGVILLAVFQGEVIRGWILNARLMVRNFYGPLWVGDSGKEGDPQAFRKLRNGVINHGEQWLNPSKSLEPTTYYCRYSGIGLAFQELESQSSLEVGVLGLGTGTLAAYGRQGDVFRFYEINPLVLRVANTEFTYLKDTPAKVEVVLGDGRLSLEREHQPQFDLLVVDAFTSDSIPVHLLTREAFDLYFRRLRPNGVLAVHISNRYLNLAPIVEMAASAVHRRAMLFDTQDDDANLCFSSKWVLASARPGFFESPDIARTETDIPVSSRLRPWTDDYSNLFEVLK